MVNAAAEILGFIAGYNYASLEADCRTQAAVLYGIVVIGEAANHLSNEFQMNHPNVPWKDIIGMRNILAHQYDKVDSEVVWDVVHRDILELLDLLRSLLSTNNR